MEAFAANPSMTYTVDDLAAVAYPGLNRTEKKHRVAVIRAAEKATGRASWRGLRMEKPGHPIVFFNLLDHRSYVIGRIRASLYEDHGKEHAEIAAAIDEADPEWPGPRWKEAAQPGNAFWLHVEINRAEHEGDTERAEALRAELKARIGRLAGALG